MSTFTLTRKAALAWSGEHEWRKGQSYVPDLTGLTVRPEGTGTVLRGVAYGQEPYQVRVTLAGGEVVGARCSCPVGSGGGCKHVAALLARAVDNPGAFEELPELSALLDGLSVPELHRLIGRMLDRAPHLEALVYASAARNAPAGGGRAQIEAAFAAIRRDYNPEWDPEGEGPDTEAIALLLEEADTLLENPQALDATWAGQLLDTYLAVLDGVEETYDEEFDWGLDDLQERALVAVERLVASGKLADEARAVAIEAVQSEVASGQGNLNDETFFAFVEALRADERAAFLDLLRDLMQERGYDFQQKQYARTLYHLTANDNRSDEEAEALLRAGGDLGELVDFLLERGRVEDARRAVREAGRHARFPTLEAVFTRHGQLPLLEDLARESAYQPEVRHWLFGRSVAAGRKAEAHALAREAAFKFPREEWLTALKRVSPDWEGERGEIIRHLWGKREHTALLMDLLLRENLTEDALRLLGERKVPVQQLLTLAGQLDAPRAVPLIVRAAQAHIDERHRGAYHEAARILTRLPALIGKEAAEREVRAVMERQPRLSALRDELRRAGLLPPV